MIRAVRSARAAEPGLSADEIVALVSADTGTSAHLIGTGIRDWAAYPDEIDAWIDDTDSFEARALLAWERRHDLRAR